MSEENAAADVLLPCWRPAASSCKAQFKDGSPCIETTAIYNNKQKLTPSLFAKFSIFFQVRRRRYFENSVELKKRKKREAGMKAKRNRQFPPKSFSQVTPQQEPSPFNDMFGTPEDIFADVLVGDDAPALSGRNNNYRRN